MFDKTNPAAADGEGAAAAAAGAAGGGGGGGGGGAGASGGASAGGGGGDGDGVELGIAGGTQMTFDSAMASKEEAAQPRHRAVQRSDGKAEAKKRAAEEQAVAEAKAREEWPIVCQTEVWGCGASGVEILGKFDGTIRDNVIELNSAEGLALSSEAGGVVRANRFHSNGLDGVSRRRRTSGFFLQEEGGGASGGGGGDEPGETLLAENYGQNWCVGAAVSCKVRQRLDVMPATWQPSSKLNMVICVRV
jgi:parallel beta-helix repeat protein